MIASLRFVDGAVELCEPELIGLDEDGFTVYVVTTARPLDELCGLDIDYMPGRTSLRVESTANK